MIAKGTCGNHAGPISRHSVPDNGCVTSVVATTCDAVDVAPLSSTVPKRHGKGPALVSPVAKGGADDTQRIAHVFGRSPSTFSNVVSVAPLSTHVHLNLPVSRRSTRAQSTGVPGGRAGRVPICTDSVQHDVPGRLRRRSRHGTTRIMTYNRHFQLVNLTFTLDTTNNLHMKRVLPLHIERFLAHRRTTHVFISDLTVRGSAQAMAVRNGAIPTDARICTIHQDRDRANAFPI